MNQSEFLAITWNSLEAREKPRVRGASGFGFAAHRLKNWRESFKPITKRSNRNHVITFDSQLKTAVSVMATSNFAPHFAIRIYTSFIYSTMASFDENFHSGRLKVAEVWNCVEGVSKRTRNCECSLNFRPVTASLRSLDFTRKFIPRKAPRDQEIIATRRVILSNVVYHSSSQTKTMLPSKPHSLKLPCALVVVCLVFMFHLQWTSFFLNWKPKLVRQYSINE